MITPDLVVAFLTLTFLEIVLGIDNIIFISILANRFPVDKQKKLIQIGLFLAMILRIAMLSGISLLIQIKTTLFNVIAGVLKPTSGIVFLDNENITSLPPHQLFDRGLLRTFQIAHEFHSMTCRENLMMVPSDQSGEKLWNTWFGRKRIADEERALSKGRRSFRIFNHRSFGRPQGRPSIWRTKKTT